MSCSLEEKFIVRAEELLKAKFPESFRKMMMQYNGPEIFLDDEVIPTGGNLNILPIYDDSDRKRIRRTFNDIVRETKTARIEWELDDSVVVIGENGSGDLLTYCIESDGKIGSKVYWWSHELRTFNIVAEDISEIAEPDYNKFYGLE